MEHTIIGWKVARTVDASLKDLALYRDLFKVIGVATAAGVVAYIVRNMINPHFLLPRIAATGVCVATTYLAGMFVFRLPGHDYLTKERLMGFARSTLGRLRSANA